MKNTKIMSLIIIAVMVSSSFTWLDMPDEVYAIEDSAVTFESHYNQQEYVVVAEQPDDYISMNGQEMLIGIPYGSVTVKEDPVESDNVINSPNMVGNASKEEFITDCSTDYAFQQLQTHANGYNMQMIYKALRSEIIEILLNGISYTDEYKAVLNGKEYYVAGSVDYGSYGLTSENVSEVFYRLHWDNPLFFPVQTFLYDGWNVYITIDEEFIDGEFRRDYLDRLEEELISLDQYYNKSNYYKAKVVHDIILNKVDYAYEENGVIPKDDIYTHSIAGYIYGKNVVCDGYADTFAVMMSYLDVNNVVVYGWGVPEGSETTESDGHAWNLVRLNDGRYWHVDCTYDDSRASQYDYFCLGDRIYIDHSITYNSSEPYLEIDYVYPEHPDFDFTEEMDDGSANLSVNPTYEITTYTYSYDKKSKTLTFSGVGVINQEKWTEDRPWGVYADKAEKLVIEDGITGIEYYAFHGFKKLKEIDFPDELYYLRAHAFSECDSLTEVFLPDEISFLDMAFVDCSNLEKVVFGEFTSRGGYIYANGNPFYSCLNLKNVVVPEKNDMLMVIDNVLCTHNGDILCYPAKREGETYRVPDKIRKVGQRAFANCSNLRILDLGNISHAEATPVFMCDILEEIIIPETLTKRQINEETGEEYRDIAYCCDDLKKIINNSDKEIELPNDNWEATDGVRIYQDIIWKDIDSGKYVATLKKGVVTGEKVKRLSNRFIKNKMRYWLASGVDLLEAMNSDEKVRATVTVEYCDNANKKGKIGDIIEYNGCKYKIAKFKKVKHSWQFKVDKPATTKSSGKTAYYCGICKCQKKNSAKIVPRITTQKLKVTKYAYTGSVIKPEVILRNAQGGTIETVDVGVWYTITYPQKSVEVGRYAVRVDYHTAYSGTKTLYYTIVPKAPSKVSATISNTAGGYDDIVFSWESSKGAIGYLVYYKKASSKKWSKAIDVKKTTYTKKNLEDGVKYNFKVIPYYKTANSGTKYYLDNQYRIASASTLKQPKK